MCYLKRLFLFPSWVNTMLNNYPLGLLSFTGPSYLSAIIMPVFKTFNIRIMVLKGGCCHFTSLYDTTINWHLLALQLVCHFNNLSLELQDPSFTMAFNIQIKLFFKSCNLLLKVSFQWESWKFGSEAYQVHDTAKMHV